MSFFNGDYHPNHHNNNSNLNYQHQHQHHHQPARPRMPSPQPSYARMQSAAISIPSSRGSPASLSSRYAHGNGSMPSTPDVMVPIQSCSLPTPSSYMLSDSLVQHPPSHVWPMNTPSTSSPTASAMAEALSKGPGLIRRVSRGAQGIPNRFRRGGSAAQRDKSSGPVIMRRRSDSKTAVDAALDLSDFGPTTYYDEEEEEAIIVDADPIVDMLGITSSRPSLSSIPSSTVSAPKRNSRVEQGTPLWKVTKKDRKEIFLRLDLDSAKVFWDPSRPSKSFYIDDVKDLRMGADAKHYREETGYADQKYEPLWFTIVYSDTSRSKGKIKTMHLIAPDIGIFAMWTQALDAVSRDRIDMMAGLMGFAEKSARLVWQRQMKKRFNGQDHLEDEEMMDIQGIIELCRSLHINCSEKTLRSYFLEADRDHTNTLNQEEFLHFVRKLKKRKDIKQIYKQFTPSPHTGMDQQTFLDFLRREQGIDVEADMEHWTSLFDKLARATQPKSASAESAEQTQPPTMSFPAFQTFLTSDTHNSIFKPLSADLKLDRPLNEYFISSSHNTYLLGPQVVGLSSTEAYITALQKGCRCLEIDCWDGSDGKPIVTHGRTLTKSITFHDAIKVIDKYAFVETEYPLILSLEVHCSPDQQHIMVRTMVDEFGDKLVAQPIKEEGYQLPSPEELKRRILIKVKAPAEELDAKALVAELSTRKRERSFSSPWSRPVLLNDNLIPSSPLVPSPSSLSPPERSGAFWASPRTSATSTTYIPTPSQGSSADDSDSPHDKDPKRKSKKSKTSNITEMLGRLGVYTRGIKFSDFGAPEATTPNHVLSFNERVFDKLTKPGARDKQRLEEHNMSCLMRVYPSGHRITSSNFDPLRFWRRGVQMAATNWQTYDLGQQLNEAMFAGGDDRSGYVLKPTELRLENPTSAVGPRRAPKMEVKFTVQIISAQQLPRPKGLAADASISPFVQFEMYCAEDAGPNATGIGGRDVSARKDGYSGIGQPLKKRTRIVEGNGYNPEFKDEIEMTVTTRYPDLVFVRWTVWNTVDSRTQDSAPLAQFTAKLSAIQQGYRHIPLFDGNGEQYLFSRLYCRIKKQDIKYAPSVSSAAGSHPRHASVEPMSPPSESANTKSNGNFITRLIRRESDHKKRKKERTGFYPKDADWDIISHSSTIT